MSGKAQSQSSHGLGTKIRRRRLGQARSFWCDNSCAARLSIKGLGEYLCSDRYKLGESIRTLLKLITFPSITRS